jgi:hypothetical protein
MQSWSISLGLFYLKRFNGKRNNPSSFIRKITIQPENIPENKGLVESIFLLLPNK